MRAGTRGWVPPGSAPGADSSPDAAAASPTSVAGAVATSGVTRRVHTGRVAERGRRGARMVAAIRGVAVGDSDLLSVHFPGSLTTRTGQRE
jgi:hypothetical protein